MLQIRDEESARAWLSDQDQATRTWFAVRVALRSLPVAVGRAPFNESEVLRLFHHVLIASVGSIDRSSASKAAKYAFGPLGYKGSVQQLHNDKELLGLRHPRGIELLYGDEQPPTGSFRDETAVNAIGNAACWAVEIGELTCPPKPPAL